jgi:ABC-type uncharacterized transport system auxiliary subunit
MKNLAVALIGAVVLAGCGSVRYPTTYVLNFPPPVPRAATANGALGPVAIREFRCPEYLCEGRIVYRSSPEEVGFYEYHRWAMNPRQAITQYVEEGLRAQSLFKSVALHERGSEAPYVLSGNIERFEEVDQGRDVRAVCTISAQLLDTRTRSVVWSRTASETVSVEKRDIRGVVASLSAAARTAADGLLKSMTEELPATLVQTGREAKTEILAHTISTSKEAHFAQ